MCTMITSGFGTDHRTISNNQPAPGAYYYVVADYIKSWSPYFSLLTRISMGDAIRTGTVYVHGDGLGAGV